MFRQRDRDQLERIETKTDLLLLEVLRVTPSKKPTIVFGFAIGQPESKEPHMPLTLTCTNEEKIKVTVNPVTTTGKPSSLDGPVTVTPTGDSTVQPIDATTFFLVSADSPGSTSFLVEGDADLGSGIVTVQDMIVLNVVGAMAASLGLVAGSPEPK